MVQGEAQRKRWQSTPKVWMLTPEGACGRLRCVSGLATTSSPNSRMALQEGQELIIGLKDKDGRRRAADQPSTTSGPPPLRF